MKILILLVSVIILGIAGYKFIPEILKSGKNIPGITESSDVKRIPRVLFLTSGIDEGAGYISEGVIVAIETFSKHGNFVRLENRDVLLQPEILKQYDIMITPTSMGYNDGDRKYSLTFLSDIEMENIKQWVGQGGILVAEENIGRNTPEGLDRSDVNGGLNPVNWKLSDLFGIKLKEMDLNGFSIEEKDAKIWNGTVKQKNEVDEWALIPIEIISDKIKVMAEWVRDNEKYPAVICNTFGKGKAILFTSTYILHPSNVGGISSIEQIENFYEYVLSLASPFKKIKYELNPWPDAYSTAFSLSFDDEGNEEQYNRVINFLNEEKISATIFADSSVSESQLSLIEENKNITIQSNFFSQNDLSAANYSQIIQETVLNEQTFNKKFEGIRFPYTKTNFWGLLFADEKGYKYDASIGIDHFNGFEGSVFPYNIPVSQKSFYKTLNLLEISPTANTDAAYFESQIVKGDYTDEDQRNDAELFSKYLFDFYEFVVSKNNGLMVFSGSPQFTGFGEITMMPLQKLVDSVKTKNCWMTNLGEVADFRNKIKDLSVEVNETDNKIDFKINLKNQTQIKGLSFKLDSKPGKITSSGNYNLKEINGIYYLITDAKDGLTFSLSF